MFRFFFHSANCLRMCLWATIWLFLHSNNQNSRWIRILAYRRFSKKNLFNFHINKLLLVWRVSSFSLWTHQFNPKVKYERKKIIASINSFKVRIYILYRLPFDWHFNWFFMLQFFFFFRCSFDAFVPLRFLFVDIHSLCTTNAKLIRLNYIIGPIKYWTFNQMNGSNF